MTATGDPRTVYGMLAEAAHRHARSIALEFEDRSFTYAALLDCVDNAARQLGSISKARDAIIMSRTLTPDEKREKLDELQVKRNAMTKQVMTHPAVRASQ